MPSCRVILHGLLLAPALASAAAAAPSSSVTVEGDVAAPTTFGLSALQALPQTTSTETYTAGGTPVTDTFTGPTLWNVLQAAGGVSTNPNIKNDFLQTYVVAAGTDGYEAVISSGEISPKFGNKPDLVAVQDTGGTLPGADGVARVTAAGDRAGGRYVSNLDSLFVGHGPSVGGTGGGVTSSFVVQGAVAKPVTLNLAALEALPSHTETVTYFAGATSVTDTYTGALLWDVLGQAGILTDAGIKNDILRKAVVAAGSDGYDVDFAAGELSPMFGDEPVLVAYADTDGQLGLGGSDGFARIVAPGDIAGGRYVSNLSSLTVFDATDVPEPAGALAVASGLIALIRSRRRRG